MELRLLRAYVTVAEEMHFGRAAARLFITPPSLSQQIKALERSLDVRLFERDSKGVRLTPAGEELLGPARATLERAEELERLAREVARRTADAPLTVGFLLFSLTEVSRSLLAGYSRRHPEVPLEVRQYEWDDPSAGLLSGAVDVAFVRPPFTGHDRLRHVELERDPLLALLAADHPLARAGEPVSAGRLVQERFLEVEIVTDPVFAAQWYLHDLRTSTSPKAVLSRAGTSEEWLAEVGLGRGVDVVPLSVARDYVRPGLTFLPIHDLEPSRLVLAWDPARVTEAGRRFVRYVQRRRASLAHHVEDDLAAVGLTPTDVTGGTVASGPG
ncbi:MAG: LysR family transcriptional regulator [Frankiales bacterium]|nr:LysR family transcriptional regulator [Frankiales bacterium]